MTLHAFVSLFAVLAFLSACSAHEQVGRRDTGCDPAQSVAIKNSAGKILYYNNPTCAHGGGRIDDLNAERPGPSPAS